MLFILSKFNYNFIHPYEEFPVWTAAHMALQGVGVLSEDTQCGISLNGESNLQPFYDCLYQLHHTAGLK